MFLLCINQSVDGYLFSMSKMTDEEKKFDDMSTVSANTACIKKWTTHAGYWTEKPQSTGHVHVL